MRYPSDVFAKRLLVSSIHLHVHTALVFSYFQARHALMWLEVKVINEEDSLKKWRHKLSDVTDSLSRLKGFQ